MSRPRKLTQADIWDEDDFPNSNRSSESSSESPKSNQQIPFPPDMQSYPEECLDTAVENQNTIQNIASEEEKVNSTHDNIETHNLKAEKQNDENISQGGTVEQQERCLDKSNSQNIKCFSKDERLNLSENNYQRENTCLEDEIDKKKEEQEESKQCEGDIIENIKNISLASQNVDDIKELNLK